jgi:hypothetical protein
MTFIHRLMVKVKSRKLRRHVIVDGGSTKLLMKGGSIHAYVHRWGVYDLEYAYTSKR